VNPELLHTLDDEDGSETSSTGMRQSTIIALSFIAFLGFVLWVSTDHNVSTIWARVGIIIGVLTGVFLVATGMARNR
jgi:hypothetical protein